MIDREQVFKFKEMEKRRCAAIVLRYLEAAFTANKTL